MLENADDGETRTRTPRTMSPVTAGMLENADDGEPRTRTVRTMSPVTAWMLVERRRWRAPDPNRPDDVPGDGMDA
jgi:hypothetical protein